MAVATKAYLQKNGEPKHPGHLKNHSCIITNNAVWKFDNVDGSESIKVKGRWRSNNVNSVLDACLCGLGIAYMPQSTFQSADGRLVTVLEPYWGKGSSSWIVYKNKRFMPLRARLAIDFLIQHFANWEEESPLPRTV